MNRMGEKALIGDDGSQVRRKGLLAVVRTNLERLEPMPFRTQLHRIHGIMPRNGGSFYDIYSINIPYKHSI